jgi:hypothetical protein
MCSFFCRTSSTLLLTGFVAAFLPGCSAMQQKVEPYPSGGGRPTTEVIISQPQVTAPGVPGQQSGPAPPPPSAELLPLLTQVDDRIAAYEEKLHLWEKFKAEAGKVAQPPELGEKITSCQALLQDILARYNQLHEQLVGMGPGQSPYPVVTERMQEIGRVDINFVEGECQLLIAGSQQAGDLLAGNAAKVLAESEKAIAAAMAAKDYPQVIELYRQLPAGDGLKPSFESVYNYGQALLRTGRESDAGQVFASLLQDVQQRNQVGREFELMQLVADIRFGLEDYSNAFAGYVNIINRYAGLGENIEWARKQQTIISARNAQSAEVKSFAALMRAYLGFNQPRDGFKVVLLAEQFLVSYPESTVTPTVNRILFEARDGAEAWYASHLQQIGQLKDEKRYAEALQMIQGLPLQDLPPDKRAQIQALADEMTSVQAKEAEIQQVAEEAALQEMWSKAQNHLQLKEYDQAIAVFSGMLNTPFADRAQNEINAAANLAAQEGRQKAAELFVQAGSAKDQSTRVALLLQSRQLLQDILNKYPQSDLVEKVRKNLERIEQDLRAIDPALLTMPPSSAEQGRDGQPASAFRKDNPLRGEDPRPAPAGLVTAAQTVDSPPAIGGRSNQP